MKFEIPEPLKLDQDELQLALQRAGMAGGRTGAAARHLANLLHPHLDNEEKDMLHTLTLLLPMSRGQITHEMRDIPARSDRLKAHVFGMVREHTAIIEAARKLLRAARSERKLKLAQFTERLLHRAWMDEVVFYPAAILAGEYLKLVLKEPGRTLPADEPRITPLRPANKIR